MSDKLTKIIENLGLEAKEARVYLAALEMSGGTALQISRRANIERANTYYVLEAMINKGLIYESKSEEIKHFHAISPSKFQDMAKNRYDDLLSAMPELKSIENDNDVKPKIRYYEGIPGIKQAYEETISDKNKPEILSIASAESIFKHMDPEWIQKYVAKRVKRQVSMRAIVEESDEAKSHKAADEAELRETRLVPAKKFKFKNEINVFGNKIMIASYRDQMAVIIESTDTAETNRAFFELAWEGAEKYK